MHLLFLDKMATQNTKKLLHLIMHIKCKMHYFFVAFVNCVTPYVVWHCTRTHSFLVLSFFTLSSSSFHFWPSPMMLFVEAPSPNATLYSKTFLFLTSSFPSSSASSSQINSFDLLYISLFWQNIVLIEGVHGLKPQTGARGPRAFPESCCRQLLLDWIFVSLCFAVSWKRICCILVHTNWSALIRANIISSDPLLWAFYYYFQFFFFEDFTSTAWSFMMFVSAKLND
jgi:hypothetical protein